MLNPVTISNFAAVGYNGRQKVNYTVLLLHYENSFIDSSRYGATISPRDARWSSASSMKKWGDYGLPLGAGYNNCDITLATTVNPALFSADWWCTSTGNGGELQLTVGEVQLIHQEWGSSAVKINGTNIGGLGTSVVSGHHYAFTSNNGTYKLYKDGSLVSTVTGSTPSTTSTNLVKVYGGGGMYGIDELCLVSDMTREVGNTFPVPTGPYTGNEYLA